MKSRDGNSDGQFRLLFDANPQPMFVYDRETLRILEVNDAAVLKYGYSRMEFLSLTLKDFRPPEDVERMLAAMKPGRPKIRRSGEWRHRLKDGAIIDVDITAQDLIFKGRDAVLAVAHDITERKRAERKLKEREELLLIMGKMAKVGVWEFDVDTMKGTWNEEVARIHEVEFSPDVDVSVVLSSYSAGSRGKIESAIRDAIDNGKSYDLELEVVTPHGNRKLVRVIGAAVKDGDKVVKLRSSYQDITDLRAAEERWNRSRILADHALDPIIFSRVEDHRIVEANQAALMTYGYSREEMLKLKIDDLREPGERLVIPDQLAEADKSGMRFESVHFRKDGSRFPVEVSARGIDIDGRRAVISVIRDITSRREADDRLRRHEQTLQLLIENSPAAIAMFDVDMKYVVASRRYLSDYKIGDVDIIGKSHYEVFPEIPQRWKDIHSRCLQGRVEKCDEDPFPRADGTVDWVKWEIRPWYQDTGEIAGIILLSEVITERKAAQEELLMTTQRLLGLINSAMDGIVSLDENQNVILFNPASEKMFGISAEEMMGKPIDLLIPEKSREIHPRFIEQFGKSEGANESRRMLGMRIVTGRRANGEEFPMEASISHIEVAGKKVYTVIHRDVTEQLKARRELRESEEKFRSLYENSSVGIYRTTPDGKILMANPALVAMLGYESFEDLSRLNLQDQNYGPKYSREKFLEIMQQAGEIKGLETSWTRADGRVIFVRESARAIRDSDGETAYFDGVVEDITERKLAEEQLLVKNAAIESSISPIGLADMDGRVFYVNAAFLRLWGYNTVEEVIGKRIEEFGNSPERIRMAENSMLDGAGYFGDAEATRRDGTRFDYQISANIVRSPNGKPVCMMASFIDITERKGAEAKLHEAYDELKESEEKYRSLFEQSKDAIIISLADGTITDCNKAALDLLGYETLADLQLLNMKDMYLNIEQRRHLLDVLLRDRYAKDLEVGFKRKDGEHIVVNITASTVFDEITHAQTIVGIARDITRQKNLEAQLIQAQKLESLGTLAGGIAHDFNNILGIIIGYSALLEGADDFPERHSRNLKAIQKAADRGAGLVRQLLTFARKSEWVQGSIGLNDVALEVAKLLGETLPKTVNLVSDLDPSIPAIVADGTQIHQVLLNLCVNARDAMPNGGTIRISTSTADGRSLADRFPGSAEGEYVLLTVSDDGVGMDEATKRRIFDPFFTTKEIGKGTGLGLALVHSIVSDHRGYIDVETEPNRGTKFTIYLPVRKKGSWEDTESEVALHDAPEGNETILIIEDESMLRELMRMVLVSKGYEVITADNGEDGIKLFNLGSAKIAAVISDIGLPRLPGDEVLLRLRAIAPGVKLIAASGFLEPAVKAKLVRAGVEHYVQKPYAPADILRTVRDALDGKGA